jgi:hypothetical protein
VYWINLAQDMFQWHWEHEGPGIFDQLSECYLIRKDYSVWNQSVKCVSLG